MEAAPLAAKAAEKSSGQAGVGLLELGAQDFGGDQAFFQDGCTAAAAAEEVAIHALDAGWLHTDGRSG